jgi:hypothetical protein
MKVRNAESGHLFNSRRISAVVGFSGVTVLLFALSMLPIASGVVAGHSPISIDPKQPIVLLVIDPLGNEIGCTAVPCTSTSSPNYVNNIPAAEGPATYDFATNTILIEHPYVGTWTVDYIGTGTGPFTITATTCPTSTTTTTTSSWTYAPPTFLQQGCSIQQGNSCDSVTVTLVTGSITPGQSGSTNFNMDTNGNISFPPPTGVPEFPAGMAVVMSLGLVAVLGARKLRNPRTTNA